MILTGSRYAAMPLVMVPTTPDGRSTVAVFGPRPAMPKNYSYYTVIAGDRWDLMAQRFYGRSDMWWLLADANPEIPHPDQLQAGTIIRVP